MATDNTPAEKDWASLVTVSDKVIKRQVEATRNPIKGVLDKSWAARKAGDKVGASLEFKVSSEKDVEAVVGMLRRDSRESEHGVSIQYFDGRGTVVKDAKKARVVAFAARTKRQRQYTADEVRQWLRENGRPVPNGRLPKETTAEFRAAMAAQEEKTTQTG